MKTSLITIALFFNLVFATYNVGDTVSEFDQNIVFDVCNGINPANEGSEEFRLADFNGDLNGGSYYVFQIDMAASWCDPCFNAISLIDEINQYWMSSLSENYNQHVIEMTHFDDPNQPYSCTAWANQGSTSENFIIEDGNGYTMHGMFNTENAFPSNVWIDHTMTVYYKGNNTTSYFANLKLQDMLDNCEPCNNPDIDGDGTYNDVDNCPEDYNPDQTDSDDDGLGDVCDGCDGLGGIDSDEDGYCDGEDQCAGFDDNIDNNENGTPDGCDAHFDCLSGFYNPMGITVLQATINNEDLALLDEIAVFDGDLCVGSIVSNGEETSYSIIVPEDNPSTEALDGFIPGNDITFKMWNHTYQVEVFNFYTDFLEGDFYFTSLGNAYVNIYADINTGCADSSACNYNGDATVDDGSCWYVGVDNDYCDCQMNIIDGCDVCGGNNYNLDECGICFGNSLTCAGCMDEGALNYDLDAIVDDGSCEYLPLGDINFDGNLDILDVVNLIQWILDEDPYEDYADATQDGNIDVLDIITVVNVIVYTIEGCTNPVACNYDPDANFNDGSCEYPEYECFEGYLACAEQMCDSECYDNCGGMGASGTCHCDSVCVDFGDCCGDVCYWCGFGCASNFSNQELYNSTHDENGNRIIK